MKFNFSPSKEFKEKTKTRFLAVFDAHNPALAAARPRTSEFVLALRAFAIVLACVAVVFGGAATYADTKNVPADNPLYPLKRLSESVQLALTAPVAKPELEATFAEQRASEITDLSKRHPSSTLIPHLAGDLSAAVDAAVAENGNDNIQAPHPAASPMAIAPSANGPENNQSQGNGNDHGDLQVICTTLQSFLNPTSSMVKGGFLDHSQAFQRFQDRCGESGAVSSSTAAITSTSTLPFRGVLPGRPRGFLPGEEKATTTLSATSGLPVFQHSNDDDRRDH